MAEMVRMQRDDLSRDERMQYQRPGFMRWADAGLPGLLESLERCWGFKPSNLKCLVTWDPS